MKLISQAGKLFRCHHCKKDFLAKVVPSKDVNLNILKARMLTTGKESTGSVIMASSATKETASINTQMRMLTGSVIMALGAITMLALVTRLIQLAGIFIFYAYYLLPFKDR